MRQAATGVSGTYRMRPGSQGDSRLVDQRKLGDRRSHADSGGHRPPRVQDGLGLGECRPACGAGCPGGRPHMRDSAVLPALEPAADARFLARRDPGALGIDECDRITERCQRLPDLRFGRLSQAADRDFEAGAGLFEQCLPVSESEPPAGREGQPVEVVTD